VDKFHWHTAEGLIRIPPPEVVEYLEAVKNADVDRLRNSLNSGAHVDTPHRCGMTGLIMAADSGADEIVRLLLERGADPYFQWSTQNALFYAEKNKDGVDNESGESLLKRQRTYSLLLEKTPPLSESESRAAVKEVPVSLPQPPPQPPLHFSAAAEDENVARLVAAISDVAAEAALREDAAWALRAMTHPDLRECIHNTGMLVAAGAVEPLAEMLRLGPSHGCKEQAIAVLRNIARVTTDKTVGHHIRKVIRVEAGRWAGIGTPESKQRISEMEKKIRAIGGVCVVKNEAEIEKAMAAMEMVH